MCHADGNEFKKSLIIMYSNLLLLINGHLENSALALALASASVFKYETCLLYNRNHLYSQKLVIYIFRNAFNNLQYVQVS